MFTGLVEGQGTVRQIAALPVGLRISVAPDAACFSVSEISIGDSISICGCCLTVVAIHGDQLDFEAGDETLSKTNLGRMKAGGRVNLERSLAANARLGGHFVQGHVDGVAAVNEIVRQRRVGRYVVHAAAGTASAAGSQRLGCDRRHQPDRGECDFGSVFRRVNTTHAARHDAGIGCRAAMW